MIEIKNITKKFGSKVVLNNISFEINKEEFVVLIGSSGCGKTTLLKMLNKLILPTSGEIIIDGKAINKEDSIKLRRNIGYVIQQTGLFPHMTVRENIEIIPKLEGKSDEELKIKTIDLLKMVDLDPEIYMDRYPAELSGGQQQRVGVARAFATDAEIILMDEPFSALDPLTRSDLQDQLFTIQKELRKTIIFVTHDMDEAIKLADKICILRNGEIVQYDTPESILKSPANDYVEEFIGSNKFWSTPEYIKAKDIMITNPVRGNSKHTIIQAINIMMNKRVDSLVIVDKNGKYDGLVRLSDMQRIKDKSLLVSDVINREVEVIHPEENFITLLNIFNNANISYIPVVDEDEKLKGLITKTSLLSVLSNQFSEEGGQM